MKVFRESKRGYYQFVLVLFALVVVVVTTSCRRQGSQLDEEQPEGTQSSEALNPGEALTLQAEAAATAAWVARLTPIATEDTVIPTLIPGDVEGTPLVERVGSCPVPPDFQLHERQGFCVAAPESWSVYNVDGGAAATLGTTPGQVIAIRPDWAASADICTLTVYITTGASSLLHLQTHYQQFERRIALSSISPLQMYSLAGMAVPGFLWQATSGMQGGIFADTVAVNRIAHIGYDGSDCAQERLIPVLETLRFNVQ